MVFLWLVMAVLVCCLGYTLSELAWLRNRYKALHKSFVSVCEQRDECLRELNDIFNTEE